MLFINEIQQLISSPTALTYFEFQSKVHFYVASFPPDVLSHKPLVNIYWSCGSFKGFWRLMTCWRFGGVTVRMSDMWSKDRGLYSRFGHDQVVVDR